MCVCVWVGGWVVGDSGLCVTLCVCVGGGIFLTLLPAVVRFKNTLLLGSPQKRKPNVPSSATCPLAGDHVAALG